MSLTGRVAARYTSGGGDRGAVSREEVHAIQQVLDEAEAGLV